MTAIKITAQTEDGKPVEIDLDTLTVVPGIAQVLLVTARPDGTPVITQTGEYGPGELTKHDDDIRPIGDSLVRAYSEINR